MAMSRTTRRTVLKVTESSLFWILSLIVLVPFWMMIVGSFKNVREAAIPSLALPTTWQPENYVTVFREGAILQALYNSVILTAFSVLLTVMVSSAGGLFLARVNTRASRLIYNAFSLGLIAPLSIIPTIRLTQLLQIANTRFAVVLLMSAMNIPFGIFLSTGFVKSIPRELDEASIIDGCNSYQLFRRIILPLMLPVTMTVAVIVFMSVWNSFLIPLYFLNDSTKWPLPLTVYNFFGQFSSDWNLVFADLVITALPVLVFYVSAQRFIIGGLTAGAVKG